MMRETLQDVERYFRQSPELRGEPATQDVIDEAQRILGCRFSQSYVEFLSRFGCGVIGADPIYGLGPEKVDAMGIDDSVVKQTQRFRAQKWPSVENWYITSADGRGNPVGINVDGKVRLVDHDVGDVVVVAEDFDSFLRQKLARVFGRSR